MSPLRLNGTTSGYTEIDAPAVAGSNTLTLPGGNGTNGQVLTTDGAGALSFTTVAGAGSLADGSAAAPSVAFASDVNTGIFRAGNDLLAFSTGGTQRAVIDASGRLGVGTTSPVGRLDVVGGTIEFDPGLGADSTRAFNFNNGTLNFAKLLVPSGSGGALAIHVGGSGAVSERARIDNSGRLLVGATAAVSGADANGRVQVSQDIASNTCILAVENTASSGNLSCIRARLRNSSPNTIFSAFLQCDDSTANRLALRSNGGLANYSANNANLSDRNVKKDISPAADTWDCIKEWEIVNYRYKDQSDDADLNLGVIAQQVAESCPEVITVFQEAKEATEDAPAQEERLGVREQQMYWMAIKALQEAQVRIETLEARLTALEVTP
jgi:hypothetical protein